MCIRDRVWTREEEFTWAYFRPAGVIDIKAGALKDGTLTMAINQQPFLQAYFAVANLANQAKYSLKPVNVNTGTSIVTTDNIDVIQKCIAAGRC